MVKYLPPICLLFFGIAMFKKLNTFFIKIFVGVIFFNLPLLGYSEVASVTIENLDYSPNIHVNVRWEPLWEISPYTISVGHRKEISSNNHNLFCEILDDYPVPVTVRVFPDAAILPWQIAKIKLTSQHCHVFVRCSKAGFNYDPLGWMPRCYEGVY